MKRPNRKDYINKKTSTQLIADLEIYINYLEAKLNVSDEAEMVEKGKKHWTSMNVLNESEGGYITSKTMKEIIELVVDNVWLNAKAFFSKK